MIDFSTITKTVDGLDCYYIGQRKSGGKTIHRFAIANDVSEVICYYDEQGKRLDFSGAGGWVVCKTGGHQIIAPPKIVEVTRWIGYYWDKDKGDVCTDFYVQVYPDAERSYLKLLKITESIEVAE